MIDLIIRLEEKGGKVTMLRGSQSSGQTSGEVIAAGMLSESVAVATDAIVSVFSSEDGGPLPVLVDITPKVEAEVEVA